VLCGEGAESAKVYLDAHRRGGIKFVTIAFLDAAEKVRAQVRKFSWGSRLASNGYMLLVFCLLLLWVFFLTHLILQAKAAPDAAKFAYNVAPAPYVLLDLVVWE
jgi:hypothetical protein